MQHFDNIKSFDKATSLVRSSKKKLGFVPTMGALHKGHMSLVELALQENDFVAVSIFVNPTQFNNPDDLKNYPRTLEADLDLLQKYNPDFILVPAVEEIYPKNIMNKVDVDLGILATTMEGKHRPGHFNGVMQVVARLFEIVKPDSAYFGVKDFQQLAVIREMTNQLQLPVTIRSGETIRDVDGLAMSSRNVLLSKEQRIDACQISKALFFIRDNWQHYSIEDICTEALVRIEAGSLMKVEYLEIADSVTLQPLLNWDQSSFPRVFTAVQVANVRLIDNVGIVKPVM